MVVDPKRANLDPDAAIAADPEGDDAPDWFKEFLTRFKSAAKDHLPSEIFDGLMKRARSSTGGAAKAAKKADEYAKLEKADPRVKYRDSGIAAKTDGGYPRWDATAKICRNCVHWTYGTCQLVEGRVKPSGVSDLFELRESSYVELADMASSKQATDGETSSFGDWQLYVEAFFAETAGVAPEWVPFLPKPASYAHPVYGTIKITKTRNQGFVDNFTNQVYQDRLPLDAEHQTKLSGAYGWITEMRVNANGSVDAKVDWLPKGKAAVEGGSFRYISPEWYEEWTDPATGKKHKDVAIGAALTTRPFFKPPALRPLVASERGLAIGTDADAPEGGEPANLFFEYLAPAASEPTDEPDEEGHVDKPTNDPNKPAAAEGTPPAVPATTPPATTPPATPPTPAPAPTPASASEDPNASRFAEMERRLTEAENENKRLAGELVARETAARTKRFTDMATGRAGGDDGRAWPGNPAHHVKMMEIIAASEEQGEESETFTEYVREQRALAEQLHTSTLFSNAGVRTAGETGGAAGELETAITALRASDPKLTYEQAYERALTEKPELYRRLNGGR